MLRNNRAGFRCNNARSALTPRTVSFSTASWTYKLDPDKKRQHDFSHSVMEFKYAVQQQDQLMIDFCENELERMFRERGEQRRHR
jgi:hypothetical protein